MADQQDNLELATQVSDLAREVEGLKARDPEATITPLAQEVRVVQRRSQELYGMIQSLARALDDETVSPDVDIVGDSVIQVEKIGDGFRLSAVLPPEPAGRRYVVAQAAWDGSSTAAALLEAADQSLKLAKASGSNGR